jgi:hypothetical protein
LSIAAWMRAVSSDCSSFSAITPFGAAIAASRVAHAEGMLGSVTWRVSWAETTNAIESGIAAKNALTELRRIKDSYQMLARGARWENY